ncbi:uncharacterized protein BDR25DRAFT_360542 [Lindgomyces ingoldianus]|uniref:Uncharacterized protein n=1 Tax=Lindgomyces ingoldianus TaxID=673940 RepID=A0ACB6QF66_9PLEO|nr:uncharacterized protein BDR25DRAFT_360542 [Lindgomyces ingoldianus]KAF2465603.1 hypothetical protein BDR25DRAFT_360542 [Lindgomyces ingoldianus]
MLFELSTSNCCQISGLTPDHLTKSPFPSLCIHLRKHGSLGRPFSLCRTFGSFYVFSCDFEPHRSHITKRLYHLRTAFRTPQPAGLYAPQPFTRHSTKHVPHLGNTRNDLGTLTDNHYPANFLPMPTIGIVASYSGTLLFRCGNVWFPAMFLEAAALSERNCIITFLFGKRDCRSVAQALIFDFRGMWILFRFWIGHTKESEYTNAWNSSFTYFHKQPQRNSSIALLSIAFTSRYRY